MEGQRNGECDNVFESTFATWTKQCWVLRIISELSGERFIRIQMSTHLGILYSIQSFQTNDVRRWAAQLSLRTRERMALLTAPPPPTPKSYALHRLPLGSERFPVRLSVLTPASSYETALSSLKSGRVSTHVTPAPLWARRYTNYSSQLLCALRIWTHTILHQCFSITFDAITCISLLISSVCSMLWREII